MPTSDRWFHDKTGKLVVVQPPNLPIIVWIVARVADAVIGADRPSRVLDAVAFGALFTWAWLEAFQGSAHIRRVLGVVVLVAIVVGRAR